MFLNKTIDALKSSNLGGTNSVLENAALIKKYFKLKLKHEKEARTFKDNQKLDLQEIYESGLFYPCSHRKSDDVFTIVSKINEDMSDKEQIEAMFNMLVGTFIYAAAKQPYYDNEEQLKKYWVTKIKAKRDYKAFKDVQKIEQKRIRDELLDNGFIPQILNNAYTTIKTSISTFKELGTTLDTYQNADCVDEFKNSLELVMTEVFLEEIHYCDTKTMETMETMECIKFKTLDELEEYVYAVR